MLALLKKASSADVAQDVAEEKKVETKPQTPEERIAALEEQVARQRRELGAANEKIMSLIWTTMAASANRICSLSVVKATSKRIGEHQIARTRHNALQYSF